jgi:hypothetical protein
MLGDLYANTAPVPLNSTSSQKSNLAESTDVATARARTVTGDSDDWFGVGETTAPTDQSSQGDMTGGETFFGAYKHEVDPNDPGLQRERQFGEHNQE